MNTLTIPPCPNWYEATILTCAPDNTVIYGARNDIVVIYDSAYNKPADIKLISRAHSQRILSVNVNKNWGQPNKLLVTVAEDKIVKLWDVELLQKKLSHNSHSNHNKVVGATFAGEEKVVSVSDDGVIVVWNLSLNQTSTLKDIFGFKVTVTSISTCPHATWLTAFGLKNGLVVVADLRKQGKVLFKLRGHDKSVISLAWCPAPINIFPKDTYNYVGVKNIVPNIMECENIQMTCDGTIFENTEFVISGNSLHIFPGNSGNVPNSATYVDTSNAPTASVDVKELKPKYNKKNPWTNLKHADDDEVAQTFKNEDHTHPLLKVYESGDADFLRECENLKSRILGTASDVNNEERNPETKQNRPVLKAKKTLGQDEAKGENDNERQSECVEGSLDESKKDSTEIVVDHDYAVAGVASTDELIAADEKLLAETKSELPQIDDDSCGNVAIICDESKNKLDTDSLLQDSITTTVVEDASKSSNILTVLHVEEVVRIKSNTGIEADVQYDNGNIVDVEILTNPTETDASSTEIVAAATTESTEIGSVSEEVKREIPRNVPKEEEPRKEFLLASSAGEGNIYIWRAGTDGRMQTFLTVPHKPSHRKTPKSKSDKIWTVLCWVTPTMLLSSGKLAELIQWTLPKPHDKNKLFRIVHNDHNHVLFNIAAPIVISNEYNWMDARLKLNAWTIGQDRLLLNTCLRSERTNLACYPTLMKAECFALSPLDPTRLAIGTSDGTIKLWNLSSPHIKHVMMSTFYQKIQSKVVTLAWHPVNELVVGFGTAEGRVGYLDISHKSKTPTILPNFFKTQIHKIEWGPVNGNKDDPGLFVVAQGKLVMFTTNKTEKEPLEIDTPDNAYVYTFAWKPDYTMMIVSTKSCAVIIYSTDLEIMRIHYFQHRLQNILWHPDAVGSDLTTSKYCYRFAAVSNSKELYIYNFGKETEHSQETIVAKYEQCGDLINGVAWSSYDDNMLVIASEGGLAQVWDTQSNTVLHTYINPTFEGFSAVLWSPTDSDFIILASKDYTIQIWNILDYPYKSEKEISVLRKKVVREVSNESTDLLPKVDKPQDDTQKIKKPNKNNLLPNFYTPKSNSQIVQDLRKLLSWKENSINIETETGYQPDILDVFGSNTDMLKIVNSNEILQRKKGKYTLSHTLSLFKGDISTTIKEAIQEKRVNPWIIMMAPMVSPKLWQTACEVYAQQLTEESDSDPLEVATYFLACHKVQEAINVLCDNAMFREALTLAKCRLPENDSTITDVIEKWCTYSLVVGNFETAAQCNIFLGKYEAAATVLFRRSDVDTLKFATELAEKSGNDELYKAILFRYSAFNSEHTPVEKDTQLLSKAEVILQEHAKSEDGGVKVPSQIIDHDYLEGNNNLESPRKNIRLRVEVIENTDIGDDSLATDSIETAEAVANIHFKFKFESVENSTDVEQVCDSSGGNCSTDK